ncbi:MAG: DUF6567 family protein [Sediminibacterium sp.]
MALHAGSVGGSAALSSGNFDYVQKSVSGSSSAVYILGIGGMAKSKMASEAKEDMLKRNPLKSNQALANVSVDVKNSFILGLLYHKLTYNVTADVVEFKK